jgi:hypothetical protein
MRLTTPGAILLGSFVIAIAVFLGLRGRGTAVGAGESSGSPSAVAPARSALPLPGPPAASSPLAPGAVADATRALAAQHDALMKACWGPATEGRASFLVRTQFDEHGHQSSKAQLSPRGQVRLDVSECIANNLAPLEIDPANAPAYVEAPLLLP